MFGMQEKIDLSILTTGDIRRILSNIDAVYFLEKNQCSRYRLLFFADELKIELIKRGKLHVEA
jgi:hypothetical protein